MGFENCVLQEELISTQHVDYKYLLKLVETESNETINKLCPKILGKHVNTYLLTKNVAEQLIKDQKGNLPLAVFRPGVGKYALILFWKATCYSVTFSRARFKIK